MVWASFGLGAIVGCFIGMLIVCLCVIRSQAEKIDDNKRFVMKNCYHCGLFYDIDADIEKCHKCMGVKNDNK